MKVLAISLLLFGMALAVITPSHRVTEVDKVHQHNLVQDEIYKNMDLMQAQTYLRHGFAQTNFFGYDTIYLDTKYASDSFFVTVETYENVQHTCAPISDSSFFVFTYEYYWTGSAVGQTENQSYYRWMTVGSR